MGRAENKRISKEHPDELCIEFSYDDGSTDKGKEDSVIVKKPSKKIIRDVMIFLATADGRFDYRMENHSQFSKSEEVMILIETYWITEEDIYAFRDICSEGIGSGVKAARVEDAPSEGSDE